MTRNNMTERDRLEMLTIDQLILQDHLVRKVEPAIDFSFIYLLVENLYSPFVRRSINPVVMLKMNMYSVFALCDTLLKK